MGNALPAGQFVRDRLVARHEGVRDAGVELVQVVVEQRLVRLEFDVAGRSEGTVIGQADLLGQPDVDFQCHEKIPR